MTARTTTAAAQPAAPAGRADEARRAVLRAGFSTQQRALAAREGDLAEALAAARASTLGAASDAAGLRALRLSVAWHRESLDRLAERLAG